MVARAAAAARTQLRDDRQGKTMRAQRKVHPAQATKVASEIPPKYTPKVRQSLQEHRIRQSARLTSSNLSKHSLTVRVQRTGTSAAADPGPLERGVRRNLVAVGQKTTGDSRTGFVAPALRALRTTQHLWSRMTDNSGVTDGRGRCAESTVTPVS